MPTHRRSASPGSASDESEIDEHDSRDTSQEEKTTGQEVVSEIEENSDEEDDSADSADSEEEGSLRPSKCLKGSESTNSKASSSKDPTSEESPSDDDVPLKRPGKRKTVPSSPKKRRKKSKKSKKRKKRKKTLSLALGPKKPSTVVLTRPKFSEAIDSKLCQRLVDSGVLRKTFDDKWGCTEEEQVLRMKKKVKRNVLPVQYQKPKSGYGRVGPKGKLSLGSLRKAVRHTLCGDSWVDFDVANCHPAILLQLCQANNIPCTALAYYVNNRPACLAEVAALFDKFASREDTHNAAKILFIRVLYNGTPEKWREEHKAALAITPDMPLTLPACVVDLQGEVVSISKALQAHNPEMAKAIQALHLQTGKTHNFDGSFLSYYLQEWERRVLEQVFLMMRGKGYIRATCDCVLCYDGIMVRLQNLESRRKTPAVVVTECEATVLANLDLDLTFTVKTMTKSLLPQIEAAEQKQREFVFPADKSMFLDSKYANALGSYDLKKRYIEQFIAKAMRPDPLYVWTNAQQGVDEHGVEYGKYVTVNYGPGSLASALSHLRSSRMNRFGAETAFTDEWFKDPEIRVYSRVDFLPYNGVFDPKQHDSRCYNLFKGYNPHIHAPLSDKFESASEAKQASYRAQMLKPFLDLGTELFEGSRAFLDFHLKCIAKVLQNPQQKHPYCFIMTGKQGTGKNMYMDTFGRLVGRTHYCSTTNPNDLFGKHAEGFVHKIIVVMNECEGKDTFTLEGKLKGAITDVEMIVNAKCQRPVMMKNLAFITITSNKSNPVQIDVKTGERRYLCSKSTEKFLGTQYNEEYWTRLAKHLMKPEFIRCLYDYLNEMDVSNVDWKQERRANLGKAYQELAALYSPIEALYFDQLAHKIKCGQAEHWRYMPAPWPANQPTPKWGVTTRYRKSSLYNAMLAWATKNGFYPKAEPNPKTFYNKLIAQLDFPIRKCTPRDGYPRFEFDPKEVHAHIVKSKWVECETEDADNEPEDAAAACQAVLLRLVDKVCTQAAHDVLFDPEAMLN